jgi:hypothetical protein
MAFAVKRAVYEADFDVSGSIRGLVEKGRP